MSAASHRARLHEQLILHEDLRLKPYRCTSNKLTWGVGYNITDRGLEPLSRALGRPVTIAQLESGTFTRDDALKVLDADIDMFTAQIRDRLPEFDELDAVRQRAVIDFVFNLGTVRASSFTSAIAAGRLALQIVDDAAIRQACWDACAFHMMNSLWARQVDDGLGGRYGRADRVCGMIRTGKDYTK